MAKNGVLISLAREEHVERAGRALAERFSGVEVEALDFPGQAGPAALLRRCHPFSAVTVALANDRSRPASALIKLGLFLLPWLLAGRSIFVFGSDGVVRRFRLFFPLAPLLIIRTLPAVVRAWYRCLMAPADGTVRAFTAFMGPVTMWYETLGKKLLRYGSWGYVYEESFGQSYRPRFYSQWLSYGWLLNRLGPRPTYGLSALLFWLSAAGLFLYRGDYALAAAAALALPFSPYFTSAFLGYAKPENAAWFLAVPALFFAAAGYPVLLGAALLVCSYLSFTVTFFVSAAVGAVLLWRWVLPDWLALAPLIIKLAVDAYPILTSRFAAQIGTIISGTGDAPEEAVGHRRRYYGIHKYPAYIYLLLQLVFLTALLAAFRSPLAAATGVWATLVVVQFQKMRLADEQVFYRIILAAILGAALALPPPWSYIVLGLLAVHPWYADHTQNTITDNPGAYPDFEPRSLGPRVSELESFCASVPGGSRVVFEYAGVLYGNPLRNRWCILEAVFFNAGAELVPHELMSYVYHEWFFEHYSRLTPDGEPEAIVGMLEQAGADHVIAVSPELRGKLLGMGFEEVAVLDDSVFGGFIADPGSPPEGRLWLMKAPFEASLVQGADRLDRAPNRMTLHGVRPGERVLIRQIFDPTWTARQGAEVLEIEPGPVRGLPFMSLVPRTAEPVYLRFGRINRIIR